jgi:hypothetical protein
LKHLDEKESTEVGFAVGIVLGILNGLTTDVANIEKAYEILNRYSLEEQVELITFGMSEMLNNEEEGEGNE